MPEEGANYSVTLSFLVHATIQVKAGSADEANRIALDKVERRELSVDAFKDDDGVWDTAETEEVYNRDTETTEKSIYTPTPPDTTEGLRKKDLSKLGCVGLNTAVKIKEVVYRNGAGQVHTASPMFDSLAVIDLDEAVTKTLKRSGTFDREGEVLIGAKYDILQVPKSNGGSEYVNVQCSGGFVLKKNRVLVCTNNSRMPSNQEIFLTMDGKFEAFAKLYTYPLDDMTRGDFPCEFDRLVTDTTVIDSSSFLNPGDFYAACQSVNLSGYSYFALYESTMI